MLGQAPLNGFVATHGLCSMHKTQQTVDAVLKHLGLTCSIFSACCVLQKARWHNMLRSAVLKSIRTEITPSYEAPPEHHVLYLSSVFETLEWELQLNSLTADSENTEGIFLKHRRLARERLSRHLAASSFDENGCVEQLRAFCPLGCCENWETTLKLGSDSFELSPFNLALARLWLNPSRFQIPPLVYSLVLRPLVYSPLGVWFQCRCHGTMMSCDAIGTMIP